MTVREIICVPDPVLRKKAKTVTSFDDNLKNLIYDMVETMRAAPGVGLAAPQIGVLERIIVIEYYENEDIEDDEEQSPKKLYTIVNPEITRKSTEMEEGPEGCLSIPGYLGDVTRHLSITVKGQNRHGQPVTLKLKDWTARIFQHEIDHLYGVLFTDLATKIWKPDEPIVDNV
jgi:peptide deformylase